MTRKPEDFDLWIETAKTVKPLAHRVSQQPHGPSRKALHKLERKVVATPSVPHVHIPSSQTKTPPPITGLDRRTAQRLTRGQTEIDRRMDLHGTGIEMARVRLHQFLRSAQHEGARTVLVITGKGDSPYARHTLHGAGHFHAPERAGRLRRLVPEWFHEADFRSLVSGFQPAHPKHGGGGAFYVRIRRIREDR